MLGYGSCLHSKTYAPALQTLIIPRNIFSRLKCCRLLGSFSDALSDPHGISSMINAQYTSVMAPMVATMLGCLNAQANDISLRNASNCVGFIVGSTFMATFARNHLARLTTPNEPFSIAEPNRI